MTSVVTPDQTVVEMTQLVLPSHTNIGYRIWWANPFGLIFALLFRRSVFVKQ